MKLRKNPTRYHVTHNNGIVTGVGGEYATPQNGEVVLWFETIEGREAYPGVSTFRLMHTKQALELEAAALKSDQAYAAKRDQAAAIKAGATYNATQHDFIEIEVRLTGKTPAVVVDEILAAVRRDVYEKENRRVKAREKAKTL